MGKLLVITGPTATGKTKLGIELAKRFNGEIVSADSRQVYQGSDVETGKDKKLYQKAGIKVWGIDIVEPDYDFNVAEFVHFAQKAIADITGRGELPIVVGGTGLYIKALLEPFATINIPPNQEIRNKLSSCSVGQLQAKLAKVDSPRWDLMNDSDRQNPRRLIRAIETQSASRQAKVEYPKYDALVIGLTAPREVLYKKIVARRRQHPDLVPEEFAYAKRQMTYLKKFLQPFWFDITDPKFHNKVQCLVKKFIRPPSTRKKSTPTT